MKAAVVEPFGTLTIRELATPEPGPGQVRIRVTAAGMNFADGGMVSGRAARKQPPFVPGVEAAGVVDALGEGVTSLAVGQRAVYWDPMPCAFAEQIVVPAWRTVGIADGVTDAVAVALMVQGTTAHYLVTDSFNLAEGKSCLVYAAAGGVGQLLVQIAHSRGAKAVAVVGGEGKAKVARELGADIVIDRFEHKDILAAVKDATNGEGCDVVYDSVGAATIEGSLLATKRRGTCVLYGGASGPVTTLDTSLMQRAGSIFFHRPGLGDHLRDAEEYQRRMTDLFAWHLAGKINPRISGEYSLGDIAEALRRLTSGETTGKLIVRP